MLKKYNISFPLNPPDNSLSIYNFTNDKSIRPQLEYGIYEPHVQAIIADVVKKDFRCLDIGANIGIHSLLLSKLASVECIEASSENIDLINKNFISNGVEVPTIHEAFLGDGSSLYFSRAESNHACSYTATTQHSQSEEVKKIVQTKRLYEIIDWQPDFIKMDIEGAEYNTITSSLKIFENLQFMVIELNKFTNETFFNQPIGMLTDLLFELYTIKLYYNNNIYTLTKEWLDDFFTKNVMLDVLCVRK